MSSMVIHGPMGYRARQDNSKESKEIRLSASWICHEGRPRKHRKPNRRYEKKHRWSVRVGEAALPKTGRKSSTSPTCSTACMLQTLRITYCFLRLIFRKYPVDFPDTCVFFSASDLVSSSFRGHRLKRIWKKKRKFLPTGRKISLDC